MYLSGGQSIDRNETVVVLCSASSADGVLNTGECFCKSLLIRWGAVNA